MTTKEQVLEAVEQNHIWINAFSLAEATDERPWTGWRR